MSTNKIKTKNSKKANKLFSTRLRHPWRPFQPPPWCLSTRNKKITREEINKLENGLVGITKAENTKNQTSKKKKKKKKTRSHRAVAGEVYAGHGIGV